MNTASTTSTSPPDSRSTSIDHLGRDSSPLQQSPSDTDLVNDILKEINQQTSAAAPTTTPLGLPMQHQHQQQNPEQLNTGSNSGVINANSAHLQQQTNDTAFARQVDPNLNHGLPPANPQQVHGLADTVDTSASSLSPPVDTTGIQPTTPPSFSHTTDPELVRVLTKAQTPSSDNIGFMQSFYNKFDAYRFAKTILLCMLLYVLVSHNRVQTLLCKVPSFCAHATQNLSPVPQLSLTGTVVVAFLIGVSFASADMCL